MYDTLCYRDRTRMRTPGGVGGGSEGKRDEGREGQGRESHMLAAAKGEKRKSMNEHEKKRKTITKVNSKKEKSVLLRSFKYIYIIFHPLQ